MKIIKEIEILAPVRKVFEAYADIRLWKDVFDDVVDINLLYDDGLHQEFDMAVLRNGHTETVRSIRFCFPFKSIEIFQTIPPPQFTKMIGAWTFISEKEKTVVKALREFESPKDIVNKGALLEKFLERNLKVFKKWIETRYCIR